MRFMMIVKANKDTEAGVMPIRTGHTRIARSSFGNFMRWMILPQAKRSIARAS